MFPPVGIPHMMNPLIAGNPAMMPLPLGMTNPLEIAAFYQQ